MIVYLGWGSLIWDPRDLQPLIEGWRSDGPMLPVEYCRTSNNGRLTLVVTDSATPLQVLWTPLKTKSKADAIRSLKEREDCKTSDIHFVDTSQDKFRKAHDFQAWMNLVGVSTVIWTALPPKFNDTNGQVPSAEEALTYLKSLKGNSLVLAKEYICKTPKQIQTKYRALIERELGWTLGQSDETHA